MTHNDPATLDEYLILTEVARLLRVTVVTAEVWCRTGKLPATKVGKSWRVSRAELSTWLAAQRDMAQRDMAQEVVNDD